MQGILRTHGNRGAVLKLVQKWRSILARSSYRVLLKWLAFGSAWMALCLLLSLVPCRQFRRLQASCSLIETVVWCSGNVKNDCTIDKELFLWSCYLCLLSLEGSSEAGFKVLCDVDWPSLFEYCGEELLTREFWICSWCWDLVAALRLGDDLAIALAVLGTSGRLSWAFHEPGLDRRFS
ncbi:hypothetical protein Nepgr_033621 [Nepenthes gracilis]|uniref:Uncharacterized protein n=1 Tax=Nepenthes gracilis TaxID=150966 RepID=A0AAD3TLS5_NEPGR|nr:hypothetical protein Nepgr_033621 [Nepenthes gracilis]